MARPAILCKLRKGKLIDAQPNFVETFNWMVDFINNLRGEGEINAEASTIVVDRTDASAPVIRGGGKDAEGGELTVVGTDGLSATGAKIVFRSADDANVAVTVSAGSDGVVTATVGAYYVESGS